MKKLLIFTIVLFAAIDLHAQNSSESKPGVLIIHDVDIEKIYAAQMLEEYNKRKSEFEPEGLMYYPDSEKEKFKKLAKEYKKELYNKYYQLECESIALKIKNSYQKINNLAIQNVGTPNPNTGYIPITINGVTKNIKFSFEGFANSEGAKFHQNWQLSKVTAEKQLNTDGNTFRTFNIAFTHPLTGTEYAFTEKEAPLFLNFIEGGGGGVLPGVPDLELVSAQFVDKAGNLNNTLNAQESGKFVVKVKNIGTGPSSGLTATLKINDNTGLIFEPVQKITGLANDKTYTFEYPVRADKEVVAGNKELTVQFKEELGLNPPDVVHTITTHAFKAPKLAIISINITEEYPKDGNGVINKGDVIRVNYIIKNVGEGIANDVFYKLLINDPNIRKVGSDITDKNIGGLNTGETFVCSFSFTVTGNYDDKNKPVLPIEVQLTNEGSLEYGGVIPLRLAVEKGAPQAPVEFLAEIDKNVPKLANHNPNAVAVIIGNQAYQNTHWVDYAVNDASSIRKYLVDALGYDPNNILYYTNIDKATFEKVFGNSEKYETSILNKKITPGKTELLFCFVGHGIPGSDNKAYFLPIDADIETAEIDGISREVIFDNISKMNPKSATIILDACFSGQNFKNNTSFVGRRVETDLLTVDKFAIFTATGDNEVASWYTQKSHSMFTYFFLKAIYDKTTTDTNNDRIITYGELYNYISNTAEGVPQYSKQFGASQHHPVLKGNMYEQIFLKY